MVGAKDKLSKILNCGTDKLPMNLNDDYRTRNDEGGRNRFALSCYLN